MNWRIEDISPASPETLERNGSRFLSGNGLLGLRASLDESLVQDKPALMINGLYDQVPGTWREPVNAPNPLLIQVEQGEQKIQAQTGPVLNHKQWLDYRYGLQGRRTEFNLPSGTLSIESLRYVEAGNGRSLRCRYKIEASAGCTIRVNSAIDAGIWDINGPHLGDFLPRRQGSIIGLGAQTLESGTAVAVAQFRRWSIEPEDSLPWTPPGGGVGNSETFSLSPGQPLVLELLATVLVGAPGAELEAVLASAMLAVETSAAVTWQSARSAHELFWDQRWARADVVIDGDPHAQEALRFSIYHLLAIVPPVQDQALSIPARGLSGQVYKGGIFWDTELFMLPFFLANFPDLARGLIDYRIQTLAGAQRKAKALGYRGAFYAWESQDSGDDACTLFNVNDVFTGRPMRTFFKDRQIHISADVAWAIGQYWRLSGQGEVLLAGGAKVIVECGRFLASWVYWKPGKQRYEVLDVTGPDEYHERVHNDYYTNRMCQETFKLCDEVASYMEIQHPEAWLDLIADPLISQDLTFIREILPRLYVPAPHPETSLIPQFDDYHDLEDIPLSQLLARKLHPHEYLGGGNGLARWTTIIKQADVVLAQALFPHDHDLDVMAKNFAFYEPRTEHGSSLSACAYALAASRLGQHQKAYSYFLKTARVDLDGSSKQYVGDLYIGGTHPAANGGAWLVVLQGFCGLRLDHQGLYLAPALPPGWLSVTFHVHWRGLDATIKVGPGLMEITPHETTSQGTQLTQCPPFEQVPSLGLPVYAPGLRQVCPLARTTLISLSTGASP